MSNNKEKIENFVMKFNQLLEQENFDFPIILAVGDATAANVLTVTDKKPEISLWLAGTTILKVIGESFGISDDIEKAKIAADMFIEATKNNALFKAAVH